MRLKVGAILFQAGLLLHAINGIRKHRGERDAIDELVERSFAVKSPAVKKPLVHLLDKNAHAIRAAVDAQQRKETG